VTLGHSRALSFCLDSLLAQGSPWALIGERALTELLVELAPTGQGMAHLARYLRTTAARVAEDADPQMPRQVQVLLRTIRELGYNIKLPRCARCDEEKLLVQTLHDGVRACANCTKETYTRRCDECGLVRPISMSRGGVSLCNTCRRRHDDARKPCVACGNIRLVHTRTDALPGMRTRQSRTVRALRTHEAGEGEIHRRSDLRSVLLHHPQHHPTLPALQHSDPGRLRRG
jgi:hypothetical protein